MGDIYGKGGPFEPDGSNFALAAARSEFMEVFFEEIPEARNMLIYKIYPIYKTGKVQRNSPIDNKKFKECEDKYGDIVWDQSFLINGTFSIEFFEAYNNWANEYNLKDNKWICKQIVKTFNKAIKFCDNENEYLEEHLSIIGGKAYWGDKVEMLVDVSFKWDPVRESKKEAKRRAREEANDFYDNIISKIDRTDKRAREKYSEKKDYYKTRNSKAGHRDHMRWFIQKRILSWENIRIINEHRRRCKSEPDKQIIDSYNIENQLERVAKRIGWVSINS